MTLAVGSKVQITMISREWVARQKFIPKLEEIYTIQEIRENSIILNHEKYGTYIYLRWQLRLKLITPENENQSPPTSRDTLGVDTPE